MSTAELSQLNADEVLAACRQNAAEIAATLSQVLDVPITATLGKAADYRARTPPPELLSAGLAVVLGAGGSAAILALPESTNLLPGWTADPDATGTSRLSTLAQELSLLLLPDSVLADQFKAARVRHLAGAIDRGKLPDPANQVRLDLTAADGRSGTAILVWPASDPAAVLEAGPARPELKAQPPAKPKHTPHPAKNPPLRLTTTGQLPIYSQSLLKIQLPVAVTLARKRQPLSRIIEFGPGSIIQFEKSCDAMLDLEVGGRSVASGEAVKVGDKFGLRVTSMVLPGERFKKLTPQ